MFWFSPSPRFVSVPRHRRRVHVALPPASSPSHLLPSRSSPPHPFPLTASVSPVRCLWFPRPCAPAPTPRWLDDCPRADAHGISRRAAKCFVSLARTAQQCIRVDPNFAEAYSNLANALKELGDVLGAVQFYLKVLSLSIFRFALFVDEGEEVVSLLLFCVHAYTVCVTHEFAIVPLVRFCTV